MSLELVPIEKISISRLNIRSGDGFGDEEDLELIKNIESLGILQPIVVRPVGDRYEVDVGRRRFLSAREIGLEEIPCIVRESSDDEAMDASLSENIFRKGVDPVTLGRWVKMRLERGDISLSEYARRIGKPKSTLNEWLRMNDLTEEMQNEIQRGAVTFVKGLKVARMNLTPDEQGALAEESRSGGSDSFDAALERISAGKEKRGAPKGLLIVRINFGKKSSDYNKLRKLAKGEGIDLSDYCLKVLKDHL